MAQDLKIVKTDFDDRVRRQLGSKFNFKQRDLMWYHWYTKRFKL